MTDKPLKIAYEAKRITHNATGLGNYGRTIVEMLARSAPQNRYLLYTPDLGREALRKRLPECEQIEFRLPRTPKHGLAKAWWRSAGVCRELPADVSLFHGLGAELPWGLRKRGIPSVVTIHDLIFLRFPAYYKWFDRRIYTWKYRAACRQADRIIAISEATKRDIVDFFGIAPEKIDVVYQGCDESFKREVTDETKRAVRAQYGLPERYVLSVGSIEERKNLLLLVQAAARMTEPIHVVAVGKRTPYTAEVEKFAAENGLAERLHIYHDVKFADLPAFYRMAEVFVYPSRFDRSGVLRRADRRGDGFVSGRSGRARCGLCRPGRPAGAGRQADGDSCGRRTAPPDDGAGPRLRSPVRARKAGRRPAGGLS